MNIDRQELIQNLRQYGAVAQHALPAVQLIEPVLQQLETGLDLAPGSQLTQDELKDAIQRAIIRPYPVKRVMRYHLTVARGHTQPLTKDARDASFGDAHLTGLGIGTPIELNDFSSSLADAVSYVGAALERRLRRVMLHDLAGECAPILADNLQALLQSYLNLTALNQPKLIQQRLRPIILLLPKALPFCDLENDQATWTVFVG